MGRALVVEADGGSRGNPGNAGYGALVRDPATGAVLAERAESVGIASNNVAEYSGLVAGVGDELVALYEKIRATSGGIGAAALRQRRCEGCRLELNQVDINRIRAAADDEVLRCEECRRILVRTAESGL